MPPGILAVQLVNSLTQRGKGDGKAQRKTDVRVVGPISERSSQYFLCAFRSPSPLCVKLFSGAAPKAIATALSA
jgi:hypothetical protein